MDEPVARERENAARAALALVEPGMRLGLGTGRTAARFVALLGARVREGLSIAAVVATSTRTEALAREEGLPLCDMTTASVPTAVDLAVDGADEVDGNLCLIKGGGGALLREKMVAQMASRFVVIVDGAKRVDVIGRFPLPVEVVPFGWGVTAARIERALGVRPLLRVVDGVTKVTDNGNFVLDCPFGAIDDPAAVAATVSSIAGVVEHGLFVTEAAVALIGTGATVTTLHRP
ncbi:MAG: ribose-5-phosphate isomerase RpiA [Pseudomonadota bacterium]